MNTSQRIVKLAILKPDSSDVYKNWIKAINESGLSINYKIINIEKETWLTEISSECFDMVLISPPFVISSKKLLMDERVNFISNVLKLRTYPDSNSFYTWENKRVLNYYLNYFKIPFPNTVCFSIKGEAEDYINSCAYPLVAKVITGAAGLGVRFIKNKNEAKRYIGAAFSKGVRSKTGPNFRQPKVIKRLWSGFWRKDYIKEKLSEYKSVKNEKQIGCVFFQEFIPHTYEWRCVRIDDSFFAHKKLINNNRASGSLLKGYDKPSEKLLNFVRSVSEIMNITSASFDIFETSDGQFLVNEVQTFFGQSDSYQMIVDGRIGRYLYINEQWLFEEGDFNKNKSYNLRLEHVLKLIENK
ncbi:MAG TPA: hypothetical protein GXZ35_04015 [Acholeplasmataceae bacterium]|jgi:glutathione synthase/RimK-type ligase-like ATP-grasp enzyme|nr:hypothetical protein [Acholeplasmataceae bacterium]